MTERNAEIMKRGAELMAALAQRQCPTCKGRIEDLTQDGRCAYAHPCGHRVGQGDAKAMLRAWEARGL